MKEIYKVFEETATRNINAMLEHGNQTRKMVREMEEKVNLSNEIIQNQNATIDRLQQQITRLQTIVFKGGTV